MKRVKEIWGNILFSITAKRISAQQCLNDPWINKYADKTEVEAPIIAKVLSNMKTFRVKEQRE